MRGVVTPQAPSLATRPWSFVWLAAFLILLAFFYGHESLEAKGARGPSLSGDGRYYYINLASVVMDADLDLSNQYRTYGNWYGFAQTRLGRPGNPFGFGASIVWAPLLGLAQFPLAITKSAEQPRGASRLEVVVALLGTLLLSFAGLLATWAFLCRFVSPPIACSVTLFAFLGSPWVWYTIWEPSYPHAAAAALAAFTLLAVERIRERPTLVRWALAGFALGALVHVRPQDIVFAIWFVRVLSIKREQLLGLVVASGIALLVFSPQLLYWKLLYGEWLALPQGDGFMRFRESAWLEVLNSPRHGLVSWTPLAGLALGGLIVTSVWRDARVQSAAAVALAIILAAAFVNGAAWDWWAGGAYGARRMTTLAPLLALGLAGLTLARPRFVRIAVLACIVVLVAMQLLVVVAYSAKRLPWDSPVRTSALYNQAVGVRFSEVAANTLDCITSFPASFFFALRYRTNCTRYSKLSGRFLLDERVPSTNPLRRPKQSARIDLRASAPFASPRDEDLFDVFVPLNRTGGLAVSWDAPCNHAGSSVLWNGDAIGAGCKGSGHVVAGAVRRGTNILRFSGFQGAWPSLVELGEVGEWPPQWSLRDQQGAPIMLEK